MKMLNSSQSFSSSNSFFIKVFTLTILIKAIAGKTNNNYHFNCGSPTATTALGNQIWHNDEDPTFAPPSAYTAATKAAAATAQDPYASSEDDVLSLVCKAARTFHAPFTYSLPVSYGPKFVRLTFCALGTYDDTSSELFFLSLQANGGSGSFTLLHNFSAYLHEKQFEHPNRSPISKEFLVMATTSRLNLTFSPTSPAYLGFVNGIEVVDVPDSLYDYLIPQDSQNSSERSPCSPPTLVGNPTPFTRLGPAALETMARLNVGGTPIGPANDSGGMSRAWYSDTKYLYQTSTGTILYHSKSIPKIHYTTSVPEYTAPSSVYSTARSMGLFADNYKHNLTWEFNVDSGFTYLVRLHFCEICRKVTKVGERELDVLINSQEAINGIDVLSLTDDKQRDSPVCMDYVVDNVGDMTSTNASLRVTLRPDIKTNPWYHDVILNGIEIFKLNQSGGNLAGPNPALSPDEVNQFNISQSSRRVSNSPHLRHAIEIVVGVLGSVVLIPIFLALTYRRRMKNSSTNDANYERLFRPNKSKSSISSGTSSLPSSLCHFFTLKQIKAATSNFNDDLVIGVGGFGKVYKGSLTIMDGGAEVMVAIKRLNPSSKQGANEFRTEIQMLTALRHVHLVTLIGFCDENGEMILVYDYMPLGTLQDHLYQKHSRRNDVMINNTSYAPMPWKIRLMTCIGAARGLHYLHSGTNRMVIHRDVKSTNILLDKDWVAKVADFGISKLGPVTEEGYISTLVKGSIGYLDPEYLRLKQLTHKSDVYSFGAVLFEVLCARPVMVGLLPSEQVNLVRHATNCYKEKILHEIVDPNIRDEIAPECLMKFGEIADKCVRDQVSERPSMEEVVWSLQFVLQLQESADQRNDFTDGIPSIKQVNENGDGNPNSRVDSSAFTISTEILSSINGGNGLGATTTNTTFSSDFGVK